MAAAAKLSRAVQAAGAGVSPVKSANHQQVGPSHADNDELRGLIPAMAMSFRADFSIDEQELTSFARWLAAQRAWSA